MNQAVCSLIFMLATADSQFVPQPLVDLTISHSPFLNYLKPDPYSGNFGPQSTLHYITPAHTTWFQSPIRTLAVFPNLYRDSRALCSLCSCTNDYGCAYNCHKCPALCYTCNCSSSLGCRYNCDKCQKNAASGSSDQVNAVSEVSHGSTTPIKIPPGCNGLKAEAELCTWGPICQSIKDSHFPNCGYDCNTCEFSDADQNHAQEEDNQPTTDAEGENDSDEEGEKDKEVESFPDSCAILENELKLCTWGPSCQTILDAQYSECDYDCETCELKGSKESEQDDSDDAPPPVAPIVADHNWGNVDEDNSLEEGDDIKDNDVWKPVPAAVEAEEEEEIDSVPEECYQLENEINLCSWGPSCQIVLETQFPQCKYNCDTCKLESINDSSEEILSAEEDNEEEDQGPLKTEPVVAEELVSLWEQFKPDHCETVVCEVENSAWGQRPPISPVVAETDNKTESETDQGFTWADFESDTNNCVAVSGPAAGKKCQFPFKYHGVTHTSCAVIFNKDNSDGITVGWCSTKVDINGYHINGPPDDKWRNVGFCDSSCVKS